MAPNKCLGSQKLIFLEYPFKDSNVTDLIEKIIAGKAVYPKEISPLAQDLLKQILNPNPKTR